MQEVDSTNTFLKGMKACEDDTLIVAVADFQTAGRGQVGNSWFSSKGENMLFSLLIYPTEIPANEQFIISRIVSLAIKNTLDQFADDIRIKWPNDIYWKDKKIAGILIENDLTGSQISQSIIGIGININQEEFHSSAPNPVSLRQITKKETDRMEVLNSVLEHIIDLYSRIENRETDIITKIQEYYLKAQYRKEGYHPYCDAKGEFTAKLIRVEPDGHLILKDKNGSLRKYAFKEVKYLL